MFSSPTSESSCKFWQRELSTYMICRRGLLAANVGLFNDMRQYINKNRLLPVLYTLSLSTCVHNMHVSPPLIYIVMDCIMRYVFSLRVFKQTGTHTHAPQASPAFIHSFKHSLAVKLRFLTIKHSSILKVMGLYTMSLSRTYVIAVRCLQMH